MLKFEIPPWSHGQIPRERFRQPKATHRKFTNNHAPRWWPCDFIYQPACNQTRAAAARSPLVSSIAGTITAFSSWIIGMA
jgi:hypothetical protein